MLPNSDDIQSRLIGQDSENSKTSMIPGGTAGGKENRSKKLLQCSEIQARGKTEKILNSFEIQGVRVPRDRNGETKTQLARTH